MEGGFFYFRAQVSPDGKLMMASDPCARDARTYRFFAALTLA